MPHVRLSLLFLLLAAVATGCMRPDEGAPLPLRHDAMDAGVAEWRGRLPCADCEAIDTRLVLEQADGHRSYRLVEVYVAVDGSQSFDEAGEWRLDDGAVARIRRVRAQAALFIERCLATIPWGDYALVPFLYSIVGWYLVDQTHDIPVWMAVALSAMFALGLWIFRGANQQKDEFKRDPSVKIWGKPAETLGGKILVSGFWGVGRKLNYTGEIMLYWSFTLLAGFESFVPYLLPTWLICLLVHRAWRDDKRCRAKYGALWEQYCRRATFKMVPFIY